MAVELKNWRTEHGTKTVLVKEERTKLHVLVMGEGKAGSLTVLKVPKDEARYMRDVAEAKKRRTLNGAIAVFASYGRNVGQSKAARDFLREARS